MRDVQNMFTNIGIICPVMIRYIPSYDTFLFWILMYFFKKKFLQNSGRNFTYGDKEHCEGHNNLFVGKKLQEALTKISKLDI